MTGRPHHTDPHHTDPRLVLLVAAGGVVGTLARYGVSRSIPASDGIPVATLVENLLGAFLLGMLLEVLVRAGAENGRRRVVRLGVGTGALGGFTTWSGLAFEVQQLGAGGDVGLGVAYGVGSVVLGFVACTLGVLLGARLRRSRATGAGT
ncbi:fluoride efflux transporter FluC [Cellulomonas sp. URHB0016]